MSITLWKHQQKTADFYNKTNRSFDTSDAGTGKTFPAIADIDPSKGKTLIFCPKSLIHSVWQDEIRKLRPELKVLPCDAVSRNNFYKNADIYITNNDAVKWVEKNVNLNDFYTLIVDESSDFKHHTSARSKSLRNIKDYFTVRRLLSATPHAGNISDIWHQVFIVDDGNILGTSFTRFRQQTMDAKQVGPMANMIKWINKPGIEDVVAMMIAPLNIRHKFEDCVSIPEDFRYTENYYLTPQQRKSYDDMRAIAHTQLQTGVVTAVNAASVTTKLLQIASGAVYNSQSEAHLVDTGRYDLIMDLIAQRDHSVVFFNWTHQREQLMELANKRKIIATFIDGSVSNVNRQLRVKEFQEGKYQAIFLHPQSAAHGITLTTGNTTIWASPTYLSDYFIQGNARVRRAGQKRKTETILIQAADTVEEHVYEALEQKLSSIELLHKALES